MANEDGLVPGASTNLEDRNARAYDFGRMTSRVPAAVATPQSVEELAGIVRSAARDGVELAVRGGGHSQGGQSLSGSGVVLDTRGLNRIQPLGPELVRAQGGAQWGQVVDALRGTRRLPRVLVDIGEVTIGGTLAAGGVGTTSHRYGAQVGQVEQLEVVTGTGERVRCSATRNKDLFDAARSGQGQFGIITEAWIRLRPAGERFRQHELRYTDFERFEADLQQMVDADRFDHLRAEIRCHEREIILYAGIEYEGEPDDEKALEGLGHDEIVYTRDTTSVGRAGMWPSWGFSWLHYHPWRDWLMPWETLRVLLAQPWVDSRWLPRRPWSWTGIYPMRTAAIDAPLFMRPPGELLIAYSILPVLGQYQHEKAHEVAARLGEIDRTLVGLGGKSYLSGGVGYGREQWAAHYGEMLATGIKWKREYDPQRIFRAAGMPFGDSPADSNQ